MDDLTTALAMALADLADSGLTGPLHQAAFLRLHPAVQWTLAGVPLPPGSEPTGPSGAPPAVGHPVDIEAIAARAEAASSGPWWSKDSEHFWQLFGGDAGNFQLIKAAKSGTPYAEYWPTPEDAAFIAAARADIPALIAEIRRLRAG